MSEDFVRALGQAVTSVWGELAPDVQHQLFEAAVQHLGEGAREGLAVFLHDRHPRTTHVQPSPHRDPTVEPDSKGG